VIINVTDEIPTSSVNRAAISGIVLPTSIGPVEIEPETKTGAALSITVDAATLKSGAFHQGAELPAASDTETATR